MTITLEKTGHGQRRILVDGEPHGRLSYRASEGWIIVKEGGGAIRRPSDPARPHAWGLEAFHALPAADLSVPENLALLTELVATGKLPSAARVEAERAAQELAAAEKARADRARWRLHNVAPLLLATLEALITQFEKFQPWEGEAERRAYANAKHAIALATEERTPPA